MKQVAMDRGETVATAEITAIVPTFNRRDKCIGTLVKIYACRPRPAEVIVHIDNNDDEFAAQLKNSFPECHIMRSPQRLGPGGSRNRMIDAASNALIASFDDDSYPIDSDYFQRAIEVSNACARSAIVSAVLYHPGEPIRPTTNAVVRVADFPGGACIYKRERFMKIGGYLPILVPYGIEEVDLALRYNSCDELIVRADCLRVFHDNDRSGHADPAVTTASLVNLALLAYLRYPMACWPVGVWQIISRVIWLVRNGRYGGIVRGLASIPVEIMRHRRNRSSLPVSAVVSYLLLRRASDG